MRWTIYGLAGLLLALAAGIAVLAVQVIDSGPSEEGGLLGQPTIGGPFDLVNGDGKTVTAADYAGKPMIVYFGYTYCPDVCPVDLANVADALDLLAPEVAARFQPLFITIDPERDTPTVMRDYVQNFHPLMQGLTGSLEQIRAVARNYRVYFAKVESDGAGPYLMSHSSYVYVMDAKGDYVRHFSRGATPEDIAAALKAML
jgi:cytochrome oxidase Cu insertion factor (SCO1/SenC/PrrC family)